VRGQCQEPHAGNSEQKRELLLLVIWLVLRSGARHRVGASKRRG
jgi:hypothetical protein